jgi:fructose transport system substrate-binding protein
MESCLQCDLEIDVIYAVNEPTAAGAYEALKAVGRERDVILGAFNGGCPGVASFAAGVIGATVQQYPLAMGAMGIEAAARFAASGELPSPSEGLGFIDTGAVPVTDRPAEGVGSIGTAEGLEKCWG